MAVVDVITWRSKSALAEFEMRTIEFWRDDESVEARAFYGVPDGFERPENPSDKLGFWMKVGEGDPLWR